MNINPGTLRFMPRGGDAADPGPRGHSNKSTSMPAHTAPQPSSTLGTAMPLQWFEEVPRVDQCRLSLFAPPFTGQRRCTLADGHSGSHRFETRHAVVKRKRRAVARREQVCREERAALEALK